MLFEKSLFLPAMNSGFWRYFCFCVFFLLTVRTALTFGQSMGITRTLEVSDGIPQSFISGLVQDPRGFVWIASRDGLARYDGRKFKIFRHESDDPGSLSDNIITNLFLDPLGLLWITFDQGNVDVLDTESETITHFAEGKNSILVKNGMKSGHSMVYTGQDTYWALGKDGNLYEIHYQSRQVKQWRPDQLFAGLKNKEITGIALSGKGILLVTSGALVYMSGRREIKEIVNYSFTKRLFSLRRPYKDNSPLIRKNGEVLIMDEDRLIVYSPKTKIFTTIPLPWQQYYVVPPRLLDSEENMLFGYEGKIYRLDTSNNLTVRYEDSGNTQLHTMLLKDRSGVLWAGTNGYGIAQYDLYLKQMPQMGYRGTFPEDLLVRMGVRENEIENNFLGENNPYFFRWVAGRDGRYWFSKAGADTVSNPKVAFFERGKLVVPSWKYRNAKQGVGINALAVSNTGELWGIDHTFRPVLFDTKKFTATIYDRLPHQFNSRKSNEINGFTIDSAGDFWISSSQGLLHHNRKIGQTRHFFTRGDRGLIMTLLPDPTNPDVLWLGSSSDGLLRFNKKTLSVKSFTTKDGLPNSTVYAIIDDGRGKLWCSTNKGIFSFDLKTYNCRSYVTLGELPVDEFNRFHFFKFPNGQIAFGATEGFTVFDPDELKEDTFEPDVAFTGIKINNKPVNPRKKGPFFGKSLNSVSELILSYKRNFLAFEFAGLQFNIPQKIHYRYRLKGLDDEWVMAGSDNTATYTTIPPGDYTFTVNASNTAGKWSSHVRSLRIVIKPPFWQTWWFRIGCLLLVGGLAYWLIRRRIDRINEKAREKIANERKAMDLEARALRAQMNPHFIFNCLNSIKALIQEDEKRKAVVYLTTFSKLIRGQLYNSQREISLWQELETCKLYLALEELRFGKKLTYDFVLIEEVALKTIQVPPLLVQPFIENAVIHGVLPKEIGGHIRVEVSADDKGIFCCVDDNGIGRDEARQKQLARGQKHISKGTLLAEDRIKLHNALYDTYSSVEIIDKMDEQGKSAGTRVVLRFKLEL